MRYISADLIFPISQKPISNGLLITDDAGKIVDVLDPSKDEIPSVDIEKFEGILCPGFVNAHCHLELSHLEGKLSQKKGLPNFISEIVPKRDISSNEIEEAIVKADKLMYDEGIVAVGDISNTSDTLEKKSNSRIYYHSFVELFDIFPGRAENVFANGLSLRKKFGDAGQSASIVPHAPYTVTEQLLKMICDEARLSKDILCIHNQETPGEDEMFEKGKGSLIEKLQQLTGAYGEWKPKGRSSLASIIENFPSDVHLQLVHNTFSKAQDVHSAREKVKPLYWCLCPKANLFIEDKLPDIKMLSRENCKITVGTDSYASNTSLSILEELKTIAFAFPDIDIHEMLQWATLNGADFLGRSNVLGSFERGKIPGVVLITNTVGGRLNEKSLARRVV